MKVDVHINNGGFSRPHAGNGHATRSEVVPRETSEHAYEQICVRQEEIGSVVGSSSRKKPADNVSDSR